MSEYVRLPTASGPEMYFLFFWPFVVLHIPYSFVSSFGTYEEKGGTLQLIHVHSRQWISTHFGYCLKPQGKLRVRRDREEWTGYQSPPPQKKEEKTIEDGEKRGNVTGAPGAQKKTERKQQKSKRQTKIRTDVLFAPCFENGAEQFQLEWKKMWQSKVANYCAIAILKITR